MNYRSDGYNSDGSPRDRPPLLIFMFGKSASFDLAASLISFKRAERKLLIYSAFASTWIGSFD